MPQAPRTGVPASAHGANRADPHYGAYLPLTERSGCGADPRGGHGQRDTVLAGCAQGGGGQQGCGASRWQIGAA
jgi:hypothetical protein